MAADSAVLRASALRASAIIFIVLPFPVSWAESASAISVLSADSRNRRDAPMNTMLTCLAHVAG
ncbi:hypothetical protein KC217_24500, partial [Mycobacterium tuberculosis]|nr:hypothetical protein [Mycobacterium tuberculosis]